MASLRPKKALHQKNLLLEELRSVQSIAIIKGKDVRVDFSLRERALHLSVEGAEMRYLGKTFPGMCLQKDATLLFTSDGSCLGEKISITIGDNLENMTVDPGEFTLYKTYAKPPNAFFTKPKEWRQSGIFSKKSSFSFYVKKDSEEFFALFL